MPDFDHSQKIMLAHAEIMETIVDTLPSGLLLLGESGNILKLNQRGHALLMLDSGIPLQTVHDFPEYLNPLKAIVLEAKENIQRGEVAVLFPNRPEEFSTIGFGLSILTPKLSQPSDMAETILALTFTDITQVLKDRQSFDKIKDELHQSKKLASIGTMISGVAHELNNPLTGISMSSELSRMNLEKLLKELQSGTEMTAESISLKLEKTLGEVTKITKACQKAAVLVGELLSYSKPSQLVIIPTNYVSLVEETVQALKSHPNFGQVSIEINRPEDAEQWHVLLERVKIEQVFYNLCKNACDAMDGTGKIEISFSKNISSLGDTWLVAHVKDNGPGMDTSVLARIFDPFFSTKGNKGVGLGLSISYRTIEQHGGLLSVESKAGEWTEFQVALPLIKEPVG